MINYAYPIVSLVAMLLRPKTSFPINLPLKISEAISELQVALSSGDIDNSAQLSHRVLELLWTAEWTCVKAGHSSDPTIQYFSLSTLREDGNFLEPKNITNPNARLVYCMRLVFLRSMHNSDLGLEDACRALQYFFVEKNETTFNTLRSLQHLASNFAYTALGHPKIVWLDRITYLQLLFKGDKVDFQRFPAMLGAQEEEMVRIWEEELMLGKGLSVKSGLIHDDLSETKPGYSFVSDGRNTIFKSKTLLLDAIMGDPTLRERFVEFENPYDIRFNMHALRRWLASYSHFQLLQLVRSNLTTGSPSRGTELTAMLRQNTATNPMRNLVFFGKFATILCTYSKTSAATRSDKCIPHALDGFSSDLMVQDMAIGRPFAEFAAYLSYSDPGPIIHLYRNHLFVNQDKLFTTADLKVGIEQLSVRHLDVKLGVNGFRHVSTAFRRKICNGMEQAVEEDENDSIAAQQSGHSRHTENRVYGLSADAMAGAPEDLLPLFLDASTDWQIACKVVPGGLGLTYSEARATNFDSLVQSGKIVPRPSSNAQLFLSELQTNAHQLFSRLGSRLDDIEDRLTVPVNKGEFQFLSLQLMLIFSIDLSNRLLSFEKRMDPILSSFKGQFQFMLSQLMLIFSTDLSNRFLSFENRMDLVLSNLETRMDKVTPQVPPIIASPEFSQPSSSVSSNPTLIEPPVSRKDSYERGAVQSASSSPIEISVENKALEVLRRLLRNPKAEWTCETQRQGVLTILELKQDVLAIMATGSGKTMLAIIPALLEPNYVTIIILPFRSLMADLKRRLDEMDVPYEVYVGKPLNGQANIVLVSADFSQFDSWKEHINNLNNQKPVVRQVYDEVHEPLVAQNYREAMRNVYRMRTVLQTQLVGLSGTVNNAHEKALFEMFEFGHDTVILRTGSNRPELKFIWPTDKVSVGKLGPAVKEVLDEYPPLNAMDRALIFVTRLHIGNDIASALGFDFYHGDLDDADRSTIYRDWKSGKNYAMVCTSAFGSGNDYAHTRLIIHAGSPLEMTAYVQQVGRSGRDNKPAICYLIPTPGWVPDLEGKPDYGGKEAIYKALSNNQSCIRFKITSHFDPKGTYCSTNGHNQLCSFCEKLVGKGSRYACLAYR